jgi:predicted SAM-dependent methyltransferase
MFDTIVSFHTIEHIYPDDIDLILQKSHKLLKDDGYFITSIPYERAYDDGVHHVAFYNENSLSELFENNGFETVECLDDNRVGINGILTGVFRKK